MVRRKLWVSTVVLVVFEEEAEPEAEAYPAEDGDYEEDIEIIDVHDESKARSKAKLAKSGNGNDDLIEEETEAKAGAEANAGNDVDVDIEEYKVDGVRVSEWLSHINSDVIFVGAKPAPGPAATAAAAAGIQSLTGSAAGLSLKPAPDSPPPAAAAAANRLLTGSAASTLKPAPSSTDVKPAPILKLSEKIPSAAAHGTGFDKDQLKAVEAVEEGLNMFINGMGGTGKSTVLKHIVAVRGWTKRGMVVSPTGITAYNLGKEVCAQTLYKFSNVGHATDLLKFKTYYAVMKDKWSQLDFLIIKEISMFSADFLDWLDHSVWRQRGNFSAVLGGIQVIVIGLLVSLPQFRRPEPSKSCTILLTLL